MRILFLYTGRYPSLKRIFISMEGTLFEARKSPAHFTPCDSTRGSPCAVYKQVADELHQFQHSSWSNQLLTGKEIEFTVQAHTHTGTVRTRTHMHAHAHAHARVHTHTFSVECPAVAHIFKQADGVLTRCSLDPIIEQGTQVDVRRRNGTAGIWRAEESICLLYTACSRSLAEQTTGRKQNDNCLICYNTPETISTLNKYSF